MSLLKPATEEQQITLRKRLERVLYDNGITIQQFARCSEINYNTLRSFLTNEKSITYITRGKIERTLSEFESDANLAKGE